MKIILVLPALLLLVATSAAQNPQQTPAPIQPQLEPNPDSGVYSLKLKSQVVVLDVVVTDKAGNIVRNLKKEDFLVTENKTEQTIRSLDQPDSEAARIPTQAQSHINSTAELDKLAPNAPVSIIVLGEGSTSFNDQAYARYSLKEYLKSQGDVLNQPVMLAAADFRRFMVLHDYTTSKKEVLRALDAHFANPPFAPLNPANSVTMGGFRTLEALAQATQGHPGHKNVIWIGNGSVHVNIGSLTPDQAVGLREQIATATNMLRDARVTLYMVDPSGVGQGRGGTGGAVTSTSGPNNLYSNGFGANPFNGVIDFNTMAIATGGKVFFNRNDVDSMIGTSLRDGTQFYTLSYVPSAVIDTADKFRSVKVEMRDHNLQVSSREGYFSAAPALPPVKTAAGKFDSRLLQDINGAGTNLLVYDGLPLTVKRDPAAPDKFLLHMEVSNSEPQVDLNGKPAPDLTLLVNTFDRKGKLLLHDGRFVTLHSSAGANAAPTRTIDYPFTVATATPAARIRFVVRDNATGKLGADNVFLVDRRTLDDAATGLNTQHPTQNPNQPHH